MDRSVAIAHKSLRAEHIMAGLGTEIIGRQVVFFKSVGSTNVVAREMADGDTQEGLVVLADEQTAGRGRYGRRWHAPAGSSLLMSVLFRPALAATNVNLLTMTVSLAAIDGIHAVTGLDPALKWPNDIVVHDRKVAGLLTEASFIGDQVAYVVVGLGLNVNFQPAAHPDIPPTAASLMSLLGAPVDRLTLVRAILRAADRRYRALRAGQSPLGAWMQHLTTLGQSVKVTLPHKTVEGRVEGVNPHGHLQLRQADGSLVELAAGDVVTLRSYED